MSSTFYQYSSPTELVADIEAGKKIFYEKGVIDSISVSSKPSEKDGFIFIYTKNYNTVFQNINRFSYRLTEFRQLTFSQESLGLYFYFSLDEVNNTLYNWKNVLTASERATYIDDAYKMINKGFKPKWKHSWNLQATPAPIVSILFGSTPLTNNQTIYLSTILSQLKNSIFTIENKGTARLNILSLNASSIIEPLDLVQISSLVEDTLEVNETLDFQVDKRFETVGVRSVLIFVETNDPFQPLFTFTIEIDVQATPVPIISAKLKPISIDTIGSTTVLEFGKIKNSASSTVTKTLMFKNEGNANLEINHILEEGVFDSISYKVLSFSFLNTPILPEEEREIQVTLDVNQVTGFPGWDDIRTESMLNDTSINTVVNVDTNIQMFMFTVNFGMY